MRVNLTAGTAKRSRRRVAVEWLIFLVLAAGLVETWLLGGLIVPCRIAGGSMAGTLLGAHRDVVCGRCDYPFPCGTDASPAAARAACPNCGHVDNDVSSLPEAGADRVLIDRAAFSIRAPRRWEIAAFRRSPQADRIVVKRIVGLPGETVAVRHGDVYVNGRIERKQLAQQRALAILVHDAGYWPERDPAAPPRWRAERPDSRWSAADGRFVHRCADRAPVDWLAYHHDRRSPVTDLCSYNQPQSRREEDIRPVSDLMLSLRLEHVSGDGALWIRAADGSENFEVQLRFDADGPGDRPNSREQATPGAVSSRLFVVDNIPASGAERLLEVSLIDRQFLVAIDGRTIVAHAYDRPEPPAAPPASPLAIGAAALAVSIGDLRVYRDVYYTHPVGPPGHRRADRPVRLAAGEFYVLGDNSPVSEDSRTWAEPAAIDAKLLLGKPLVAIPSVPFPLAGPVHFQVPNLMQMRYIR